MQDRALEAYEVIAFIGEFVLDGHYEEVTYKTFATVGNEVEVMGNIYDTPDMLYGETQSNTDNPCCINAASVRKVLNSVMD